ncbi:hypothetical protein AZI86_06055 [Bdellovibrio bacteriovorus]|uniref:Ketosynthase family 3 (KS3) domain-containing protein n=1 Tax=Bdellovibrio bacteriovorus TaxID=959 RepID=A0A150WQG2_BDEBC|nr:polyketide synthase [Bdellovibrio bacteriovorus]KYG66606.1 hypothetical protein AZI86_06055 [Bdellovibrio bacteriovorus]
MKNVAITGMGCIFSHSPNTEQFWVNILSGKSFREKVPLSRWNPQGTEDDNKKYFVQYEAAVVDDSLISELRKKWNIDKDATRLEVMVESAAREAIGYKGAPSGRGGLVLGMMNPDDEFNLSLGQRFDVEFIKKAGGNSRQSQEFLDFEDSIRKKYKKEYDFADRYGSHLILDRIQNRLGLSEDSIIVDAACASSIAAMDIAMTMIRSDQWDYALVGGAETNLSQGSFKAFDVVGALSKKGCKPFDRESDGLLQGEGCGLLLIQKIKDGEKSSVFISSVGGASDGRTTSLFQPNVEGQTLAYRRAHKQLNFQLDYLEAHGTGTVVGDQTEVSSIVDFFKGQKIPTSSTKFQFGHTKAAAGAAGLIKAIKMLEQQKIPQVKYLNNPITDQLLLKLEERNVSGEINSVGVSSFGFGGSSFHCVVSKNPQAEKAEPANNVVMLSKVGLSRADFSIDKFLETNTFYKIPPNSRSNIDAMQILGLAATLEAFSDMNRDLSVWPFEDTAVISTSTLGLEVSELMAKKLKLESYIKYFESHPGSRSAEILNDLKKDLEKIGMNEDFATGVLNNVIAGRVCHAFDMRGISYNIEAGPRSLSVARNLLFHKIAFGENPLGVLIHVLEKGAGPDLTREGVEVEIYAQEQLANKLFLKPKLEVGVR